MSASYRAVGWNRAKRLYDGALVGTIVLYLAIFVGVGFLTHPDATVETLAIRGLGTAAFLLLHAILTIGPLCRLSPRFLPLLYNRRHLGVTTFVVGLAHGAFATIQFHSQGDLAPLVSLFGGDPGFHTLGLAGLAILFLMAATSHDFWLAQLTPPIWKTLHMGVYLAYALLGLHVAFGALRSEAHSVLALGTAIGMIGLLAIHLAAALTERRSDVEIAGRAPDGWVDVGPFEDIPDQRARILCAAGERIAVFRYGNKISAVSNVCQHQNGPLGEGRIVDGCITCPWHGYQYRPESGRSPEPFTEKIPTFETRVIGGRVFVDPRPLPPGTPVRPADGSAVGGGAHGAA